MGNWGLVSEAGAVAGDAVFRFGRDGKPFYIPGPNHCAPLIRRRTSKCRPVAGEDGFGFEIPGLRLSRCSRRHDARP
jgi:hypothetical protein